MSLNMSDNIRRIEQLEKGHVKLLEGHEKHQETLHEHETAIKLHEQTMNTAIKEVSGISKGLADLNKTVSKDLVPMMITMAAAKETKSKLEARIGKVVLGVVSIIAVAVSVWTAFFKGS
jgi:hypothetical protein